MTRLTVCKLACAVLLPFGLFADWRADFDDSCSTMLLAPVVDLWVPIPNLISHWKMNDNAGNTVVESDADTYYNGASARSTSTMTTNGRIASALAFTNKSDYVQFAALTNSRSQMSYSLWVNTGDPSGEFVLLGGTYYLFYFLGGSVYCHNGSSVQVSWSGVTLPTGQWAHLAMTQRSGSFMTLYLNGVTLGEKILASGGQIPTYIGRTTASGVIGFVGAIDDVRIYNNCISSAEVFQVYNGGSGTERQ